ncbi:MAG: SH3 domain-containing protein [Lachnospiraceae bacterium]|nr:SH3 domain-containing protein [Lachnospiraceae bacterium]
MRFKIVVSLCTAICLAFLLSGTAQADLSGIIVGSSAHIYSEASESSTLLREMVAGLSVTVLSSATDASGRGWFYVRSTDNIEGYILSKYVRISSYGADASEIANMGSVGEAEAVDPNLLYMRILDQANLRAEASVNSQVVTQIPRNTELTGDETVENEAGEIWYRVSYNGMVGYVRSSTVALIDPPAAPQEEPVQEADAGQVADDSGTIRDASWYVENEVSFSSETAASQETEAKVSLIRSDTDSVTADYSELLPRKRRGPDLITLLGFIAVAACVAAIVFSVRRMLEELGINRPRKRLDGRKGKRADSSIGQAKRGINRD